MGYTLINRDDPSIESFRGAFFKIRRALGTTAFGINEVRLPPGSEGVEHDEVETGPRGGVHRARGRWHVHVDGEAVAVTAATTSASTPTRRVRSSPEPTGSRSSSSAAKPQPEYDGRAVPVTAVTGLHHVQVAAPLGLRGGGARVLRRRCSG